MVPMLVHAYNCTRSTPMGFIPYFLMYGQKPQLPGDLYLGTQRADMNATNSTYFMQQLWKKLKWEYKTAQHVIKNEKRDIGEITIIK